MDRASLKTSAPISTTGIPGRFKISERLRFFVEGGSIEFSKCDSLRAFRSDLLRDRSGTSPTLNGALSKLQKRLCPKSPSFTFLMDVNSIIVAERRDIYRSDCFSHPPHRAKC